MVVWMPWSASLDFVLLSLSCHFFNFQSFRDVHRVVKSQVARRGILPMLMTSKRFADRFGPLYKSPYS